MASKTAAKLVECKIELEDCILDSSVVTDSEEEDNDYDDDQNDCTLPSVTWELLDDEDEQVLVNSLGYTYKPVVKNNSEDEKGSIIEWRCTVRNKTIKCQARVLQQDEEFSAGEIPHCHVPLVGGVDHVRAKLAKRKATIAKLDALDDELLSLEDSEVQDPEFMSTPRTPAKRRKLSGVRMKKETQFGKKVVVKKEKQDNDQASLFYTDLTWTLLENGTNRGNPQLYNSMGYCYTLSTRTSARAEETNTKYWRCAIRNKSLWCNSSVIQRGEDFKCVGPLHCHGPKPGGVDHSKIRALVRDEAMKDPTRPSCDIVDAALARAPENVQSPSRPLLIKEAGRWKCKLLGTTPKPNFGQKGRLEKIAAEWAHLDWEIVSGGSNRGADYLINNLGYTYTRRKNHRNGVMTDWRCSVRTKTNTCKATVTQRNNLFAPNEFQHTHPPRANSREKATLRAELKKIRAEELADTSTPTSKLIDTVIQNAGVTPELIGKRETIIRCVNKKRKDAKERVLYGGMPPVEHSYTTASPAPFVHVMEQGEPSTGAVVDISAAAAGGDAITYTDEDDDDGSDMLMGSEFLGELQQAEDGTLYLYHQTPPPTSTLKSKETTRLKARIQTLEKELQTYKQKVQSLQNTPNRPMVIKLSKGTVQTVACDHQAELSELRNFRDAAQVCRSQLRNENKILKQELEDVQTKYQTLSQQMALKEAEWVEREAKEVTQEGPAVNVYQGTETIMLPAQRLTAEGGTGHTYQHIQVPAELIQGVDQSQTIEVPGELIESTAYEIVTTTVPT